MIIVRTARESDIDGVLELAKQAFPGMTTLPPDRAVLAEKLTRSIKSIAKEVNEPSDESYFLVTAARSWKKRSQLKRSTFQITSKVLRKLRPFTCIKTIVEMAMVNC